MRAIGYQLLLHLREHKTFYLVSLFLLIVGLTSGSATANRLSMETSLGWGTTLGGTLVSDQGDVFGRALWREVRFFGLIALCGIGIVGIPAAGLLVCVRGFIVGFTTGFLTTQYGLSGLFLFMVAVLPQNLLIMPAALASATSAIRAPLHKQWGRRYWITWAVCLGAAVAGCLVEMLLSGLLPSLVT